MPVAVIDKQGPAIRVEGGQAGGRARDNGKVRWKRKASQRNRTRDIQKKDDIKPILLP